MDPYNHSTPISIKLLILNIGKFEQWEFRIQQYLQHEHYALWEVIEFDDSYKALPEATAKDKRLAGEVSSLTKKKGRAVAITAEDMYKRKNDEAILKTFDGNEATKKTKKNQLKRQYGNFKAEGSEILKQTFNRLQAIDWSYMAEEDEASKNHALVADEEEVPIKYALMAKSSSSSDNEGIPRDNIKSKLVNFVSKPLHTLHMDLFGPTSISSLNHKWYCLVVTDDFSRYKRNVHQAIKENESPLRFIVLPNRFHEAQMASSNAVASKDDAIPINNTPQQEQQEINKDKEVPESSVNSNPTATTKVSTNDLFELASSSTVETKVPTVSTPVRTDSLSAPLVTSSVPIIISKGGSSFPEPLSLGNAMSFKNSLADFFRDTSNAVSLNEVEANLSNMETPIQVSPTPTLKIHKDHLKSQIIGHVDTHVQTRQKTKNVDKQSFIAIIHQKTNPDLLQYCLFSCFLLQEEPKKIVDAIKDLNQTLFIRKHKGEFLLVQVYVDDIIFGSSNPKLCKEFETLMHDKFKMSAMGELNFFLGLQVLQKKDGIFVSQDKYVGDILKKFRYIDIRASKTPMDRENPWGKDGTGKDMELHLYRSMIESLIYLIASRPNIMFAICACARHKVTPKECHLYTVKRIFRYLKGNPKLGLWYPKESPFDLVAYSDSDYGCANQDRKSTTRCCQFLERRLISWQCKKQTIVATYTTEAEYVAATSGCGQVLWIQNQLLDYGYALTVRPTVYVSHIQQFWSTTRVETTDGETKILAKVNGRQRTISESSIRRHLKLNDEEDETAFPLGDVRYGEAFPTHTSLDVGQDRENIAKTSAIPHETLPRVTSLGGGEGSMQQKLQELMDICTSLQRQHSFIEENVHSRDLEITQLKAMVKTLEDNERRREGFA
nr:uncharacterized mitochondrial protein AtMg00810-like [Tanacetum cinerariifolium]